MTESMQKLRYTVRVETADVGVSARFESWILNEHGRDLLSVPGCIEYRLFKHASEIYSCEYLFVSEQALKTYYDNFAAGMRQKGSEWFAADELKFSRDESTLIGQERRSGQD